MKITKYNFESGQSLFEVVVALGISALIIVALVSLVSNSIQNANFSRNKTLAANYAQEATEWLRQQRDSDITNFEINILVSEGTPRCFNSLDWSQVGPCSEGDFITNTPFVRQITFASDDTTVNGVAKTIFQADITVSWIDSQGVHTVTNATSFSDWRQR